jgi:hypothetical protein
MFSPRFLPRFYCIISTRQSRSLTEKLSCQKSSGCESDKEIPQKNPLKESPIKFHFARTCGKVIPKKRRNQGLNSGESWPRKSRELKRFISNLIKSISLYFTCKLIGWKWKNLGMIGCHVHFKFNYYAKSIITWDFLIEFECLI